MMADIVMMHPKTLELLKENSDVRKAIGAADRFIGFGLPGMRVITSEFHPVEEWNGRYVLPNGKTFDPKNFRVSEGLVEYGPKDLPLMEFMGIAKKLMVPWIRMKHDGWAPEFLMLTEELRPPKADEGEIRRYLMNRWGMW